MIRFLFLLLLTIPNLSLANTCPSGYLPLTGSDCPETVAGCNISKAPCSPTNGCKTRIVNGTTSPGGLQDFCIDPGESINFLKIETKVAEGCGSARTLVKSPGGWNVGSNTGSVVLNADSNTITPPITINVVGEVRADDFTIGYVPTGGGGGQVIGPSCDPPDQPTPVASPTPRPTVEDCNRGLLPPLNLDGFPGWLGLRRIGISPTEVHTWCVNLNWDTRVLTMSVVDRTGTAQCFYHIAEFIPPSGSGISSKGNTRPLINTNATFSSGESEYLPKGIWKIRIDPENEYTSCPMSYEVTAH